MATLMNKLLQADLRRRAADWDSQPEDREFLRVVDQTERSLSAVEAIRKLDGRTPVATLVELITSIESLANRMLQTERRQALAECCDELSDALVAAERQRDFIKQPPTQEELDGDLADIDREMHAH